LLALIAYSRGPDSLQTISRETFNLAEKECACHGGRLLALFPQRQEEVPHGCKLSSS